MFVNISCNTFYNYSVTHGSATTTAMVRHKARPFVCTSSEFTAQCDGKIMIKKVNTSNKMPPDSSGQRFRRWVDVLYLYQGTCKKSSATKVKTCNILAMPDIYSLSLRRKGQVKKCCTLKMVPDNIRALKQKPKNPVYSTNDKKTFRKPEKQINSFFFFFTRVLTLQHG